MQHTKKPKVQIKRQKVSLGWAYRIYIDGTYMGTGLTQASAHTGAQRMLANYERARRRGRMTTFVSRPSRPSPLWNLRGPQLTLRPPSRARGTRGHDGRIDVG